MVSESDLVWKHGFSSIFLLLFHLLVILLNQNVCHPQSASACTTCPFRMLDVICTRHNCIPCMSSEHLPVAQCCRRMLLDVFCTWHWNPLLSTGTACATAKCCQLLSPSDSVGVVPSSASIAWCSLMVLLESPYHRPARQTTSPLRHLVFLLCLLASTFVQASLPCHRFACIVLHCNNTVLPLPLFYACMPYGTTLVFEIWNSW